MMTPNAAKATYFTVSKTLPPLSSTRLSLM